MTCCIMLMLHGQLNRFWSSDLHGPCVRACVRAGQSRSFYAKDPLGRVFIGRGCGGVV